MRRTLSILGALLATFLIATPVGAITHGTPDNGEHPYVGELLFYVPDEQDPRFADPGGWFTCTGTLLNANVVVTAGHCTFGVGLNGASTTHDGADTTAAEGGVGGNDVWINFSAAPDFSILPPSSTFTSNAARYAAWSAALNAHSGDWHRGVAHPHPQFDNDAFFVHDAGVVVLNGNGAPMSQYGQLVGPKYLDRYAGKDKHHVFETAGYGLEKVTGKADFGGDTRRKSDPALQSTKSNPPDTYLLLTNNAATGGTCFGDSGGPLFDTTTSRLVVAVTSFGLNNTCTGRGGVYRLDEPDDQAFIGGFLN
jgi:hypothetical protein